MAPPARAETIPPAIAPNIITSLKWLETNNLFNNLIQRNQSAAFSSGKVRPNHETNINIIARRTGKDVNSHTVLDGIITTIMATIQRINIIGSREGSRNRRRLKANQTGKKFRVGIKSNISTNRNNLISGRSEERFSRNAETDLVCRLLLEKKNNKRRKHRPRIDTARPVRVAWRARLARSATHYRVRTVGGSVIACARAAVWRAFFFFFNDTATTEIYTLSLHDALPI